DRRRSLRSGIFRVQPHAQVKPLYLRPALLQRLVAEEAEHVAIAGPVAVGMRRTMPATTDETQRRHAKARAQVVLDCLGLAAGDRVARLEWLPLIIQLLATAQVVQRVRLAAESLQMVAA